jgi:tetratricopeptide (TPR) repeat protein
LLIEKKILFYIYYSNFIYIYILQYIHIYVIGNFLFFVLQEVAGTLIEVLIAKGDFYDALRYAEITYANLRDKKNGMDQESRPVAKGAFNLADVIYQQKGDLIKAEKLAREALRINLLHDTFGDTVGPSCDLLANILMAQNKLGDEVKGLLERSLAITIRTEGPDDETTAFGNIDSGQFYWQLSKLQPTVNLRRMQLQVAKTHCEEALRILLNIYGSTNTDAVRGASMLLAKILSELSESN